MPPHRFWAAIPTDIKTAGYEAKFISPIDQGSFFRKITVFSVKNLLIVLIYQFSFIFNKANLGTRF